MNTTCRGKNLCFFCNSCKPEWRDLNKINKTTQTYKRGGVIFKEGGAIDGMYFLLSGAVKVHKSWGASKDLIIRFAGKNDVLGFRGLKDNSYAISATALETSIACFIPNSFLQMSLPVNPNLSIQLMQLYANELQVAEKRMSDLAHLEVKGRIANALFTLYQKFGEDEYGMINLRISRQDIASYAGTTYETLFRIFTEWSAKGIIKTEGKTIRICKIKELQKQTN